jgi:glycosyltransferase involved in cell wall biosynthesis
MWEPDCDALIHCLETWLDRPQWQTAARAAGPAWVQSRFTWDHAVDKLLSLVAQQP